MTLKVLIVDDDLVMRTSLKTMVDWEKQGFVICSEAVNGLNAVYLIENNPPDIVITDMSMPVMDGVELMEYIEREHPRIRTIALSGYDDFHYVRQSMKKGAIDYILKHKLNSKLLLEVLESARQSIFEERKVLDEQKNTIEKLASVKNILRNEFISKLISGELTDIKEIEQDVSYIDLTMDLENLVIVAVEIDDYSFIEDRYPVIEKNRLLKAFEDISGSILNESGKALIEHIDNGDFVIIFSFANIYSSMLIYNTVISDINRIRTSLKRYLNITASFGISKVCSNIFDISKYYLEAKSILKDKFYKGKDGVFSENTVEKKGKSSIILNLKDEQKIVLFIKTLDKQNLHKFIESIFERILNNRLSYQSVQMITAELINIASKTARESGIDISEFFSDRDILYSTLQKYETITDIREWVLNIYNKLVEKLGERYVSANYSQITKKAIEFIVSNYRDNISLNDAAEYAGVSSPYLSCIFKEDTGKGFVEYLNSIRIEKAKNLIESGKSCIKDIVRQLGFNNYNYFFKVFKEYVGMTPMEYEESLKN